MLKDIKFFCGKCLHEFPVELPMFKTHDGGKQHLCRACRPAKSIAPAKQTTVVETERKAKNDSILRSYRLKP